MFLLRLKVGEQGLLLQNRWSSLLNASEEHKICKTTNMCTASGEQIRKLRMVCIS